MCMQKLLQKGLCVLVLYQLKLTISRFPNRTMDMIVVFLYCTSLSVSLKWYPKDGSRQILMICLPSNCSNVETLKRQSKKKSVVFWRENMKNRLRKKASSADTATGIDHANDSFS